MGYCRGKLDRILGVTGGKSSTTTFYKSAALPTELRQPNQTGTCYKTSQREAGAILGNVRV
jgi:hypothetical protein